MRGQSTHKFYWVKLVLYILQICDHTKEIRVPSRICLLILLLMGDFISVSAEVKDPQPSRGNVGQNKVTVEKDAGVSFSEPSQASQSAPTIIKPSEVVSWEPQSVQQVSEGNIIVKLKLTTKKNFSVYVDRVEFSSTTGYILNAVTGPESFVMIDPQTGKKAEVYRNGTFTLKFGGLGQYSDQFFPISVTYQSCSEKICLFPYTVQLDLPVQSVDKSRAPEALAKVGQKASEISTSSGIAMQAATKRERATNTSDRPSFSSLFNDSFLTNEFNFEGSGDTFLILLLLLVAGILTNITPCVYPMIPITIRILGRGTKYPFLSSSVYASGIVVTYSALAMFAAYTGSMFGQFMSNPWVNGGFAIFMLVLALSMIGFGDMTVMQNVGAKLGHKGKGLANTFAMGAGAGLIAAPCTGPILAALLTYAAGQGDPWRSSLLLFAYSLGFGIPYVFLGSAAAFVSKVQVPAKLQVTVKLCFSSVMIALALNYLRISFYGLYQKLQPWLSHLAIVCAILGVLLGFYILWLRRRNASRVLMLGPAAILGVAIFSAFHSSPRSTTVTNPNLESLSWLEDRSYAYNLAQSKSSPLMIDLSAAWCEACKEMEKTFGDPSVVNALQGWILLKEDLTEDNKHSVDIKKQFSVAGLPTVIVIPNVSEPSLFYPIAGYHDAGSLIAKINKIMDGHQGG